LTGDGGRAATFTRGMDRMARLLQALVLFGLAGCVSPEELRQQDEAACASYGFAPGTPDFAGCVQREDWARRSREGPAFSVGFGFFGGR
jgi:hypothetical protein